METDPQGTSEPQAPPVPSPEGAEPEAMPTSKNVPEQLEEQEVQTPEMDEELPPETKERTKREFSKLKEKLRAAEERVKAKEAYSGFSSPQGYPELNKQQVEDIQQQFVDENGIVDINRLNQALYAANQQAAQSRAYAQQAAQQIARLEQSMQEKETFAKYPNLDPQHSDFDPVFSKLVRDRIMVEKYAEGKDVTFLGVADEISQYYKGKVNVAKIKDEAVNQYKEAQDKRNQGPIEEGKGEARIVNSTEAKELRAKMRQGNYQAFKKRLEAAGG